MAYGSNKGRRPFERASKIGHSEVIHSPLVQELLTSWAVPESPPEPELRDLIEPLPAESGAIKAVIAIDGGSTETQVREEFPSAAVAFITLGPLYLELEDLRALDDMPFIGPEDMARLRKLQRYSLAVPVRLVRPSGAHTFSVGVRQGIQRFLAHGDGHLLKALAWLLFREWLPLSERPTWKIPSCPNRCDHEQPFVFSSGGSVALSCPTCSGPVYLSDTLRLYERIDDDHGAGGILSYLLTTLEQIVLVHLIRAILEMKASLLREVLLIKDGPLAFFGMTAPLQRPMRELMGFLAQQKRAGRSST